VRNRHSRQQSLRPSRSVRCQAIGVFAKHTLRSQISRRALRLYWSAVDIDSRIVRKHIAVLGSREKSKETLPCLLRQNAARKILFGQEALSLVKEEEECLVLDNGTAQARSELIAIPIVFSDVIEIISPGVRVQRGVAVCPEKAAAVLIGSRTRRHLNLAR